MTQSFCDMIPYRPIKKARMAELESLVSEAVRLATEHQTRSGAKSVTEFFGEFVRLHRPGEAARVFGADVPASDAAKMIGVKEVECELLGGFSAMIQKIICRVAGQEGTEQEDLHGEAASAFLKAVLHYDGSSKFSTFLHVCVQRALRKACSKAGGFNVPQEIRKLTMRVVNKMGRDQMSFDEAVCSEGVSERNIGKVLASMSKVYSASELDIRESEMATSVDKPSPSGVRKAIESVELGALEKAVLESFMGSSADKMGLSEGCSDLVNPKTGRPYSRAALSSAWKQARRKLENALKEVA